MTETMINIKLKKHINKTEWKQTYKYREVTTGFQSEQCLRDWDEIGD